MKSRSRPRCASLAGGDLPGGGLVRILRARRDAHYRYHVSLTVSWVGAPSTPGTYGVWARDLVLQGRRSLAARFGLLVAAGVRPARPRAVHLRRGAADGSPPTHQPRGHLPDRRRRRTAASTAIPASRNRRKAVMCPKAISTTTPNRTAASAPRLGTRRGLRSSGWTRSLRLRFCISTNTYSR
jgi:hypothetical protein